MSNAADIILRLKREGKGELSAAAKELAGVATDAHKAADAFAHLERQQQQLTASEIQLARAQGNVQRALELTRAEMTAAGDGTLRYNQLLIQEIRLEGEAAKAAQVRAAELQKVRDILLQQPAGSGAAGQEGPDLTALATKAFAGGAILKQGFDMAQQGAQIKDVAQSFNQLSAAAGQTGDVLLTKLRAATHGTISDLDLMKTSNLGLIGGNQQLANSLDQIAVIAKVTGRAVGRDATEAYERLIDAIVKGESRTLDELGLKIRLNDLYDETAKKLHKNAQDLTDVEKQQALLNEVLRKGNEEVQRLGGNMDTAGDKMGRLAATASGAWNELKQGLSEKVTEVSDQWQQFFDLFRPAASAVTDMAHAIKPAADATTILSDAVEYVTAAFQQARGAEVNFATGIEKVTAVVEAAAHAHQTQAEMSALASAKTAEQTELTSALEQQAKATANQLLGMGDAGSILAAQLAASANLSDQAAAAYYRAAVAANAARVAMDPSAAKGIANQYIPKGAGQYDSYSDELQQRYLGNQKHNAGLQNDVNKSQRDYNYAAAGSAEKLRILQAELAKTTKGSAAYYDKLKEITLLEQSQAKAGARAGSKEEREAERTARDLAKAQYDLLEPEQQLAELRERLASGNLAETERLQTLKDIRDLEEKIYDLQMRQANAAIDAQLKALDLRKKQADDRKKELEARRVLESGTASEAQKQAARDLLQRLPLEEQKLALDIAKSRHDAGQATGALPGVVGGGGGTSAPFVLPGVRGTPSNAGGGAGALSGQSISIKVYLDGQEIAAVLKTEVGAGLVEALESGRQSANAAGTFGRGA